MENYPENQNTTPPCSSSSLYFPIQPSNNNKRVEEEEEEEDKSTIISASRSHSEAEKRRRDRINVQLATLRKLIPNSLKMDKAMLLGSAIEEMKELRKKTIEMKKVMSIPSDVDEVSIEDNSKQVEGGCKISIKVSLCCDDRPELFSELNRVLKGLKLGIAEAELSCLAGRLKGVFCVTANKMDEEIVCMDTFKRSLKLSLNTLVMSSSNYIIKSKRRRFFFPQSHY